MRLSQASLRNVELVSRGESRLRRPFHAKSPDVPATCERSRGGAPAAGRGVLVPEPADVEATDNVVTVSRSGLWTQCAL